MNLSLPIAAFFLLWSGTAALCEELRLAVTTSFHNSGLSEILLPQIKAELGFEVHLLVVGTGQALRLGEGGDVDAILVHSRAAEEKFVADSFGTERREIMFNDFVFLGPKNDPAGVAGADSAVAALVAINQANEPFVSRGDDSGTHNKELSLWSAAGLEPDLFETAWYRSAGAGMGNTLNTASGMNAYVMSDRASWLKFGNKGDLVLLFAGDPVLFNQYAYIPISPDLHPHVKADLAASLAIWLTGDKAKTLINGYTINGETLFTHNAQPN